ncbi:MAG: DUF6873 family GME fold protein [Bacteroidales bacterium]
MKIIADSRLSIEAKHYLENLGDVLFLDPQENAYESISAHPDIYFFKHRNRLITAKNIPENWENWLIDHHIHFTKGISIIGKMYPETAYFNAVSVGNLLIHNVKYTDQKILDEFLESSQIHVNQAYTRCNLLALNEKYFITSDHGIEKQLLKSKKVVLYFDPHSVILSGQDYGFFGGCCGISDKILYVNGSINQLPEKRILIEFIHSQGFTLKEISSEPLTDCGSILFIETE